MDKRSSPHFSHEKLSVYKRAIEFIAWAHTLLDTLPGKTAAKDQLDRASTSIALNIAEGNAKSYRKDRAKFWQTALGSAVECAAILDVIVAIQLKSREEIDNGKALLGEIVAMLITMVRNLSDGASMQVAEEEEEYSLFLEQEQE